MGMDDRDIDLDAGRALGKRTLLVAALGLCMWGCWVVGGVQILVQSTPITAAVRQVPLTKRAPPF